MPADKKGEGREPQRPTFLQKAIEQAIGHDQSFGRDDDPARNRWPNLWEWLSSWKAGELHVKTPPSISIRLGPDGVLVSVSDRDLGKALDAACLHLEGVFDALESAMTSNVTQVRNLGKGENKLRKRKS